MKVDKKAVGMRVSQIRREKGMTLEEFGKLIDNAGKSTVSKWERGSSIPNNKRLKMISEVGDTSVDDLLYGNMTNFLFNFIFNNKENLNNPKEWKVIGRTPGGAIRQLAEELNAKGVKISDIENIKRAIDKKIPLWEKEFLDNSERYTKFITSNKEYKKQVYEYFEASSTEDLDYIEKVFNDSESLSFDERLSLDSKIEDIYIQLKSIIDNSTYFTDTHAILLDDIFLLDNINHLNLENRGTEYLHYKFGNRPFPSKEENYHILVDISHDSVCSLLKKDTQLLLFYFPEFRLDLLKKYFTEMHITIVIDGNLFLGYLNSNLIFNSVRNNDTFIVDLNNNTNQYHFFPTAAVFY